MPYYASDVNCPLVYGIVKAVVDESEVHDVADGEFTTVKPPFGNEIACIGKLVIIIDKQIIIGIIMSFETEKLIFLSICIIVARWGALPHSIHGIRGLATSHPFLNDR